jgi:hypothetical protein
MAKLLAAHSEKFNMEDPEVEVEAEAEAEREAEAESDMLKNQPMIRHNCEGALTTLLPYSALPTLLCIRSTAPEGLLPPALQMVEAARPR